MAWLENDRSGNVHVCFRFGGQKFRRSLRTKSRREAETRKQRLEENVRLVECGRLDVPTDVDFATFLLSGGKLGKRIRIPPPLTLQQLFNAFFDNPDPPDGVFARDRCTHYGVLSSHAPSVTRRRQVPWRITTGSVESYRKWWHSRTWHRG